MVSRNARKYAGQVQRCICSVFISIIISAGYGNDLSVADYFQRHLRTEVINTMISDSGSRSDTATDFRIEATGGYECVYNRESIRNDTVEADDGIWHYNFMTSVLSSGSVHGFGGGLMLRNTAGHWMGDERDFNGRVSFRDGAVFGGGWLRYGRYVFSGIVRSALLRGEGTPETGDLVQKPADVFNSGLFDGTLAMAMNSSLVDAKLELSNASLFSGYAKVTNRHETAEREFVCSVEENSAGVELYHRSGRYSFTTNHKFGWLTEGTVKDEKDLLPFLIKGAHYNGRISIGRTGLVWQPNLLVEYENLGTEVNGMDNADDEFFTIGNMEYSCFQTNLQFRNRHESTFGVTGCLLRASADNMKLNYYPFTSWLLFFDLPIGIKADQLSMKLNEAAVDGTIRFKPWRHQVLKVWGSTGGLIMHAHARLRDKVRYAALLPIYDNERIYDTERKFVVIKAAVEYSLLLKTKRLMLNVQQIVPIPVGKNAGDSGGTSDGSSTTESYFGGLSVSFRIVFLK